MRSLRRVKEIRPKISSAAPLNVPKTALSFNPDVKNFYHTGEDLFLEKLSKR